MSRAGPRLTDPMRERSFRAVWFSLLLSGIGDWAARLALAILVLDRTRSVSLSALVVGISFVPWIGPGQFVAARLAHLPRVWVMVSADLVRAAIYAVLLVRLPVGAVLVLVLVAAVATPPFEAARSALTVEIVAEEQYGAAITLLDMTDQSSIVVGYLVGGLSILAGGVRVGLLVNVASFLVSAVVVTRVEGARARRSPEPVAAQLGRGLRVVWADRLIRRGLVALLVPVLPAAAIEATAAAYARVVLHANANVTGELAAAVPVGILLTVPFLPRSGSARRLLRVAAFVALAGGLGGIAAFGAGRLAGALVGYFAAGVLSASSTSAQLVFQPRIRGEDRPAVFSIAQGLVMGGQAAGAAVGGLLAAAIGPRRAGIGWMGVVAVLAAVSALLPAPDADPDPGAAATADAGPGPPPGEP